MASLFSNSAVFTDESVKLPSASDRPALLDQAATSSPERAGVQRRRRTWLGYFQGLALRMLAYFIIYTLSIGPMYWIWFEAMYVDGPKWIARAYLPLAVLCDLVPPFGAAVNWYVRLWIL